MDSGRWPFRFVFSVSEMATKPSQKLGKLLLGASRGFGVECGELANLGSPISRLALFINQPPYPPMPIRRSAIPGRLHHNVRLSRIRETHPTAAARKNDTIAALRLLVCVPATAFRIRRKVTRIHKISLKRHRFRKSNGRQFGKTRQTKPIIAR